MRTVSEMIAGLKNTNPGMRMMAAAGLGYQRSLPVEALPALIEALDDPVDGVRVNAANAISVLGSAAKEAVPLLQRLVEKGDPAAHNARIAIRSITGG